MPKTKTISKNKTIADQIPSAVAKISILHVRPTILASTVCPHCDELNFVQVSMEQMGQSILHPCAVCDKQYYIQLPENKTQENG